MEETTNQEHHTQDHHSQEHHHHHHHHHHHPEMDAASQFKYDSFRSIARRKKLAKVAYKIVIGIAVFMAVLTLAAYTIG